MPEITDINIDVEVETIFSGGALKARLKKRPDASVNLTINDENITAIGSPDDAEGSLNGCNSLLKVDFSQCPKLKSVRYATFENCLQLQTVLLPPKITSMGKECFLCCENLINVELPTKLTFIAEGMFMECENLKGEQSLARSEATSRSNTLRGNHAVY